MGIKAEFKSNFSLECVLTYIWGRNLYFGTWNLFLFKLQFIFLVLFEGVVELFMSLG